MNLDTNPQPEEVRYAYTEQDAAELVLSLGRASDRGEVVGFDTEFDGVDVRTQGCAARADLQLLSFALRLNPVQLSPRGYYLTRAWVVPREGVSQGLHAWLESDAPKAIHNAGVDAHSCHGAGIRLGGAINTLDLARFAWPERARGRGFTLDALGEDFLGAGKADTFYEVFTEQYTETMVEFKEVTERVCSCGTPGCRLRKGHEKQTVVRKVEKTRDVVRGRRIPLREVRPGHPRFERALAYSARDAVLALGVYDLAQLALARTKRWLPW